MSLLIFGLVIFFGVHSVSIVSRAWRDRVVSRIGRNAWQGLYSVVALVGLILMIYGYGMARQEPTILYAPPLWLRHVSLVLMVPVLPLLIAAYLPGRIKAAARHPMLLAVKIWALAHLLSNGALGDVLLFGSFLVWAGIDRASLKRRQDSGPAWLASRPRNDVIAVVAGLAGYLWLVLGGHVTLFGVPASPWMLF
jgi:uncharacterized membrane protein